MAHFSSFFSFFPACRAQDVPQGQQTDTLPPIQVYFSPNGGCTDAAVKEIDAAKATILVQAYASLGVPSPRPWWMPINAASRSRSFSTRASEAKSIRRPISFSTRASRPSSTPSTPSPTTRSWSSTGSGHHGQLQFHQGGGNHNAENLLVIRSPELAAKYAANWQAHLEHSEKYEGKEKGYSETHRAERTRRTAAAVPVAGGFVASARSQVFHQARLQISGQDFGKEPRPLRQPGRGDPGREEAVCGVQAVAWQLVVSPSDRDVVRQS